MSGNSINNISHWKELDAHDYTKPYFEHPITKQKTKKKQNYVTPDAPHLLRLFRNWFIDHLFFFNRTIITAQPLRYLVEDRFGAKVTPLFKLRTLNCTQSSRTVVTNYSCVIKTIYA